MMIKSDIGARRKLPTSESFAGVSDHARLPGRFFRCLFDPDARPDATAPAAG